MSFLSKLKPKPKEQPVSTTPVPAQPGFTHFLTLFNEIAIQQLQTATQVKADLAAGERLQAISDGLTGVANGFAVVNPVWGADAAAAATVAQTALALVSVFIGMFHHQSPAPASGT